MGHAVRDRDELDGSLDGRCFVFEDDHEPAGGTTLVSVMRIQRILVGELGKTVEQVAPPVHRVSQNMIFQIVVSALPTNQLTLVAVYALQFRDNDIKYALSLVVPVAWLLVMIPWVLQFLHRFACWC